MFDQPSSLKTEVKTRTAPDKAHEDSIWIQCRYKPKTREMSHEGVYYLISFYMKSNMTSIENNMMQSKMQSTDWQFAVSTVDFFPSVREETAR